MVQLQRWTPCTGDYGRGQKTQAYVCFVFGFDTHRHTSLYVNGLLEFWVCKHIITLSWLYSLTVHLRLNVACVSLKLFQTVRNCWNHKASLWTGQDDGCQIILNSSVADSWSSKYCMYIWCALVKRCHSSPKFFPPGNSALICCQRNWPTCSSMWQKETFLLVAAGLLVLPNTPTNERKDPGAAHWRSPLGATSTEADWIPS